jgi:inner membrane protein
MTSYGTHLYLPFSYERVSWSIISVVDPLFTLPLIIMVVLAIWKKSKKPIYWITSYMILYLSIGVIQHGRVEDKILNMAIERGHQVENYVVKPTIGNNILWRTIYKSGDRLYVDLIRSNWIGDMKHYQAGELEARSFPKDFKLIDKDSDLYFDLQRFFHFSNNMVGYEDKRPDILIDARYSNKIDGVAAMWGLVYDPKDYSKRGKFTTFGRDVNDEEKSKFLNMLLGRDVR